MKYFSVFLALLVPVAAVSYSLAYESGGPVVTSGAPGQPTCAKAGCHDQFPLNSGPGIFHLSAPQYYFVANGPCPPDTLQFRIHVETQGKSRWGFELTTLSNSGMPLGHLFVDDSAHTQKRVDSLGREYITHTTLGTYANHPDSSDPWFMNWAPEPFQSGQLNLYVAAVAADGDGTRAGDYVYAYSLPVGPAIADCFNELPGDVNANGIVTSADVIFMVNFVFKSGPAPGDGPIKGELNCDGAVNAADIIRMVNYVFKGGPGFCNYCDQCCSQSSGGWYCL